MHLKLWDGIKDWPNDNLAACSCSTSWRRSSPRSPLRCGITGFPWSARSAVVNGTLLAFGISRTDTGVPFTDVEGLGKFNEKGFDPSPEALLALVSEIGAAAALVYVLAFTPLPAADRSPALTRVPRRPPSGPSVSTRLRSNTRVVRG